MMHFDNENQIMNIKKLIMEALKHLGKWDDATFMEKAKNNKKGGKKKNRKN